MTGITGYGKLQIIKKYDNSIKGNLEHTNAINATCATGISDETETSGMIGGLFTENVLLQADCP